MTPSATETGAHAFLGEEFLSWLWFACETRGGEFRLIDNRTVGVLIDDFIAFSPRVNDETEQVLRKGMPTRSAEAAAALRNGRRLRRAKLLIAEGPQQWSLVVDGPTMSLLSVKLPEDSEEVPSRDEQDVERIASFLAVNDIVLGLYRAFLDERLRPDYLATRGTEQAQWMAAH